MRNKKEKDKILYTNKRTGEFITSRRFNNHDYILTSVFDQEEDEIKRRYRLNESFLDELDDDDEDVYDDNFAEIKPGVMLTTTTGDDYMVDLSDNDIIDGFVRYIHNILLLDDSVKEKYKNISDIVINNGVKNSCRIYFNRIVSSNAIPKFVVSTNKNIGYLELQWADKALTRVNFLIYPLEGVKHFGYSKSFSSMSYEHYQIVNTEKNMFNKPIGEYYTTLVDNLIQMFNSKEMNVTLTKRKFEIPKQFVYSTDTFDSSFTKFLKPVCIYGPGRNTSIDIMNNAVTQSVGLIESMYVSDTPYNPHNLYKSDENFIIIAQAKQFFGRLFKSQWKKEFDYMENMVKMAWIPEKAISANAKKYALAMPLSIFLLAAPIFYMMMSADPII